MTSVPQILKAIQGKEASGQLILTQPEGNPEIWNIYFYSGQIVWATTNSHRIRRWFRSLKQNAPDLLKPEWLKIAAEKAANKSPSDTKLWELELIELTIAQKIINPEIAKAIIQNNIIEVLFGVIDRQNFNKEWRTIKIPPQNIGLDVDQIIRQAAELKLQWCSTDSDKLKKLLQKLSPDSAPLVKVPEKLQESVSPKAYQSLIKILNGRYPLWDVALQMQKPLVSVLRSLLPLIAKDIICFQSISDIAFSSSAPPPPPSATPSSISNKTTNTAPTSKKDHKKGLIVCIDDSPLIGQELTAILQPIGYEVMSILDPLQGVSILIKRKPDLIFLDLVMPSTNGYEFCSYLRKTAAFQKIPIVILTGHDTVVDRIRAKAAGSSGFLAKPPQANKVIQTVNKFLNAPVVMSMTDDDDE